MLTAKEVTAIDFKTGILFLSMKAMILNIRNNPKVIMNQIKCSVLRNVNSFSIKCIMPSKIFLHIILK